MREVIRQLRRKYSRLYATIVGDDLYIWRPLTRKEYRRILQEASDEYEKEELVCQAAVVWPEGIDFSKGQAGVPGALAPIIIDESGYGDPNRIYETFEEYRADMEHFEYQAEATIAAAFPQITFAEMEDWTIDQLLWHAVRAEWVLKNVHGRPVEFRLRPEEEKTSSESTPAEMAQQLREQGIDPMMLVDPSTLREPYLTLPVIGGTDWQNEVNWNGIREQVQRVSRNTNPGRIQP